MEDVTVEPELLITAHFPEENPFHREFYALRAADCLMRGNRCGERGEEQPIFIGGKQVGAEHNHQVRFGLLP